MKLNQMPASTKPLVTHPKDRETLCPVYLRINPAEIVVLKNILEGYDFLGLLRTLNQDRGEVVVLTVDDTVKELMALLASLQAELGFDIIEPPDSVCEDWLLAESYPDRHPKG